MLLYLLRFFAVLFLLCGWQTSVWAESYRCDKQGKVVYQDTPCKANNGSKKTIAKNSPFFWVAEKGNAKFYLLGSIHLGKPEMYPLPEPILQAFNQSQNLILEADPRSGMNGEMMQLVVARGMYPPSDSLMNHISNEEQDRFVAVLEKIGVPAAFFAQQKPWLAMMSLTVMAMQQEDFQELHGVELHLLEKLGNKSLVELESMREQILLLDSLSPKTQLDLLNQTVLMLGNSSDYFQRMMTVWRTGDERGLEKLLYEGMKVGDPAQKEFQKVLITDRNVRMTESLVKLANQGGQHFVAVGAAHLVGNDGIVALLKQRGFTIHKPLAQ